MSVIGDSAQIPGRVDECYRDLAQIIWVDSEYWLIATVVMTVVATRKCRINCNEILSPPSELSYGGQSRSAAEVVDAGHRFFFGFLLPEKAGGRAAIGVVGQRQEQRQKQNLPNRDKQPAIRAMGEFDGVPGIAMFRR